MKTTRVQLQAYAKTYISLHLHFLVNDMRVPLVSIFFLLQSTSNPSPIDELAPSIDRFDSGRSSEGPLGARDPGSARGYR
jgi:hypothetical protein